MYRYLPKYREYFRPAYYDNIWRRHDSIYKNRKFAFKSADPLYFAHHLSAQNGGFKKFIEVLHDKNDY